MYEDYDGWTEDDVERAFWKCINHTWTYTDQVHLLGEAQSDER